MSAEYQYFILKHVNTGESVTVKIGPMPIGMQDFDRLCKAEFEKRGMQWDDHWDIVKAWVAP